jgi:GT2 family glycosyltransferase
MDLSIVIVNWNTRDLLADCLDSVMAGLVGIRAEVFVVDNASTDGSPEMVARDFPRVRLIRNAENLGFAAANNVALRLVRGRHVMLLNSDTIGHGHVLSAAVAWMDTRPSVGVMGPRILNGDGSAQVSATAFPSLGKLALQTLGVTRIPLLDSYRLTSWDRRETRPVEVISGCAMVVRRSAMTDVGLLDESFFFFGEETDWCRRFAAAGWAVVFAPVGEITHFGGGSVRRLNHRRDVMLTEGTVRLHRKHGGLAGAMASYGLLAVFNASRAGFWALAAVARRPGAADRARHFGAVLGDFGKAWPRPGRTVAS